MAWLSTGLGPATVTLSQGGATFVVDRLTKKQVFVMRRFFRQFVVFLSVLVLGVAFQPTPAPAASMGEAAWRSVGDSGGVVQGVEGALQPDPGDEECEEEPGACVFGTLIGYLLAPIFDTLFTDLQGATQPYRAPFGIRLEHRFRGVGSASRAHPYVGLGVRFFRDEPSLRYRARLQSYFEAAAGYQFALQPVVGTGSFVQRTGVLAAEAQWLHARGEGRVRLQVAPGLEIDRPSNRRLRVHLTLSVTAAGANAGTVSPGLSVGYRW
jgi:hypothetical protein